MTEYELINEHLQALAKAGEEEKREAIYSIITMIEPLIRCACRRYHGYTDEDMLQDGRLRALELIHAYDPARGTRFLGYMKKMLHWYYYDRKRKEAKEQERYFLCDEIDSIPFSCDEYDAVCIEDVLQKLSETERKFVRFHILEGHTMKRASEEIGITYNQARALKRRTIEKLRIEV